MNFQNKLTLIKDLMLERQKLTWAAQLSGENTREFGERVQESLIRYRNLGAQAKIFMNEVTENFEQREQLAIYTFIRGVRTEINRYMCPFTHYKTLIDARKHAERIENSLKDLNKLKRRSIQPIFESF